MSGVRCQVSGNTCHMSLRKYNYIDIYIYLIKKILKILINKCKLDKVMRLVGGGSVINGATPSSLKGR